MKLSSILKSYREKNGLSLRDFAKQSGVSNSYLSMLESGRHPQSGLPIVPSITTLNKLASAMCIRLDDLIAAAEDMPVTINDAAPAADLPLSDLEKKIIERFRTLSDVEKNMILRSLGIEDK